MLNTGHWLLKDRSYVISVMVLVNTDDECRTCTLYSSMIDCFKRGEGEVPALILTVKNYQAFISIETRLDSLRLVYRCVYTLSKTIYIFASLIRIKERTGLKADTLEGFQLI